MFWFHRLRQELTNWLVVQAGLYRLRKRDCPAFTPKVGLEFVVCGFLAWYLNHETKQTMYYPSKLCNALRRGSPPQNRLQETHLALNVVNEGQVTAQKGDWDSNPGGLSLQLFYTAQLGCPMEGLQLPESPACQSSFRREAPRSARKASSCPKQAP